MIEPWLSVKADPFIVSGEQPVSLVPIFCHFRKSGKLGRDRNWRVSSSSFWVAALAWRHFVLKKLNEIGWSKTPLNIFTCVSGRCNWEKLCRASLRSTCCLGDKLCEWRRTSDIKYGRRQACHARFFVLKQFCVCKWIWLVAIATVTFFLVLCPN